jgi:hypothetical protein
MNTNLNIEDFVTKKIKQHYSITTSEQFFHTLQKRLLQELEFRKEDKKTNVLAVVIFSSIFVFMMGIVVLLFISPTIVTSLTTNPILSQFLFAISSITNKLLNITVWKDSSIFYYFKVTLVGILLFLLMEKILNIFRFKRTN